MRPDIILWIAILLPFVLASGSDPGDECDCERCR